MFKWLVIGGLILGALAAYFLVINPQLISPIQSKNPDAWKSQTVEIIDKYKDGIHHYFGEVRLPHSCYLITPNAYLDTNDNSKVVLAISTNDVSATKSPCSQIATRYPFDMTLEATENTTITLLVDGKPMAIRVENQSWQNPKGSVITDNPL